MIEFQGTFLDGVTSKAHPVWVSTDGVDLHIEPEDGSPSVKVPLTHCEIIAPLGKTRRWIDLPDGARCGTDDLEAMEALEQLRGETGGMRVVHFLESRWKLVGMSIVIMILSIWGFMGYGIPFFAERVAYSIPPEFMESVSQQTAETLDDRLLSPSELDPERAEEVRSLFFQVSEEVGTGFSYQLDFRRSDALGPNAFALPSGRIIMTDTLVMLAESDEELMAVFAHEIAHVEKRHGMRTVLQNAGVFLLVSAVVGDVASISSAAAALPTMLAESGYSRKFEREADQVAGRYLIDQGWGTQPMQDILLRMTEGVPELPGAAMLSTHPETQERLERLQALEAAGTEN